MKRYILLICFAFLYVPLQAQWVKQNTGIFFTIFSLSAVDNNVVWASVSGANVLRTTNGGNTWDNVGTTLPPPAGVQPCIWGIDANTALVAVYAGSPVRSAYVFKTTNGGQSWDLVFTQGNDAFITGIAFRNSTEGFMAGWPVGGRWSLWRTSNAGTTWDSTGMYIPESDPNIWSFENSIWYSGNDMYVGARGRGMYRSTNNGTNWSLHSLGGAGFVYPSAIWFNNPSTGYTSAQLNIVKTTNSGVNWSAASPNGSEVVRGIVGADSRIWYIREIDSNIYYSSNNGSSWSVQFVTPDHVGFRHITKARTGNYMWAADISGNVFRYEITTGITQPGNEVPPGFLLKQNYPNPFNPETKIAYSLPEAADVKLKIYNSLGKEIALLVNEAQERGSYEVKWNAASFESGVYFYRIEAGEYMETKKMLLVK
jgi:photosystem II stability/assembly factor-like uncharacterized protein